MGSPPQLAALLPVFKVSHVVDARLDGGEVGERAAEPPLVDVQHLAAVGLVLDGLLRLLLGANKKDVAAVSDQVGQGLRPSVPARRGSVAGQ